MTQRNAMNEPLPAPHVVLVEGGYLNLWSRWRQADTPEPVGFTLTPAHWTTRQGFVRNSGWQRDGRTLDQRFHDDQGIAKLFARLHATSSCVSGPGAQDSTHG